MATLDELLEWLWKGGEIGIFDATNSTRLRRNAVVQRAAEAGERYGTTVAVVFIESICEDRAVLEANMLTKVPTPLPPYPPPPLPPPLPPRSSTPPPPPPPSTPIPPPSSTKRCARHLTLKV